MSPRLFLASLAPLLVIGCAPLPAPDTEFPAYSNPVLDRDFPDPAVLRASDGWYYAFATQGEHEGTMQNIQMARSADLITWQHLGDALPEKPAWASRTQDFWAPHVTESDGRFYLYYSAKPDAALQDPERGLCLAVATANRPEGPFVDVGKPLECGLGFVNIDPMAFDDPVTGKRLLYWGSGFGPIKVRELAPDRVSFLQDSPTVDLVGVDPTNDPENYQRLVEGAWVVLRDGWYYLFYSGDNCCGPNAHYALMVARSRSATGPFETLSEARGTPSSVVLEADDLWNAPGHNSVIRGSGGTDWILYHAVDRDQPRSSPEAEPNTRRVMLLAPIFWADGWPVIERED